MKAPTRTDSEDLLGSPVDIAMAFLAKHYAGLKGFANVVALHSETGEIVAAGAPTDCTKDLRPFVEQHRETCNLYFSVNPTIRLLKKKATKADILCAAYLHADMDPSPERDKAELLRVARQAKPTTIVDSGNGVQVFYKLAEPLGDVASVEPLNQQLAKHLGADHCHNFDRVMRLPGTINFPTEAKRQKGRKQCEAKLVRQDGKTYQPRDLAFLAAAPSAPAAQPKPATERKRVEVPDRWQDCLDNDLDLQARWAGQPGREMTDTSGSAMDMSLASLIVNRTDLTDDEAVAVLRDYEHGKRSRPRTDDYLYGAMAKARQGAKSGHGDTQGGGAWVAPTPITGDELQAARLTPDCIVRDLYFADVGVFVGPGGVSKTTLMLWNVVHIALGWPLFGHAVEKPGPVVFVTHEDSREILVARIRHILEALDLSADDAALAMQRLLIVDVSGSTFRLTKVDRDVVVPSGDIDRVIADCLRVEPVLLVFDPAISFGVGEGRVNDAEQGLVEAGRKMRNALNCCVVYIHHVSKRNAEDKSLGQHAGRGGSALPDGCRMVHVLQPLTPEEWVKATGMPLREGESAMVLARPKMSYCPRPPNLLIRRDGYRFWAVQPFAGPQDAEAERREDAKAIYVYLRQALRDNRYLTGNDLERDKPCGLSRNEVRAAVQFLRDRRWVEVRALPPEAKSQNGHGKHKYLHPMDEALIGDSQGGAPDPEEDENDVLS